MLRFSILTIKLIGKIALIAYFVLGLLFLGARYWVFPHINDWRPHIERQLSQALSADISLGAIAIDWNGPSPRLRAHDVRLDDEQGRNLLAVPEVQATISWRSLWSGRLQLLALEADGLDLTLRRDTNDRVWVLGRSFTLGTSMASPEDAGSAADWLLGQRDIALRAATLRWVDETRNAPPLVLERVVLQLSHRHQDHRFVLQADIPEALGKTFDLRGEFLHTPSHASAPLDLNEGRGQLYVHVENMQPLGWAPWIDMPRSLQSGQVSVRSWLKFRDGMIESLTSDVTVNNGYWASTRYSAKAGNVRLFMSGPWRDYTRLLDQYGAAHDGPATGESAGQGVEYRLLARQLDIRAPQVFGQPLRLEHLVSRGAVQRPDTGWRVDASQLDLSGPDLAARLQGHWRQHGVDASGLVDVQGRIERLAVPAIRHYLPASVDPDARDWLEHGLVAGQVKDASLVLRGDLDDFPFTDASSEGEFRIAGQYAGAIIDYLPADEASLGWPRLVDMQGTVTLDRADLRLTASRALMWPTPEQSIQLTGIEARIPDLEQDSVLIITGQTQADSGSYMALMTHTPLGDMLDRQFNETRATGTWSVPLSLNIPLTHSRDTTVQGAIHFDGGELRLTPQMPVFSQLEGVLEFTDTGFGTPGLKGKFLGGPVAIEGGVGGSLKGLRFQGQAQADALREYAGLEGLKRLNGHMDYRARLRQGKNKDQALALDIQSELVGLAMDFPAPLKKAASEPLPLHISWQRHGDGRNMALDLTLGKQLRAKLLHDEKARGAYFHAAALGLNQQAVLPKSGFALDLRYPVVDMDAWGALVDEFSNTLPGAEASRKQPLLPDIQTLRLQADKLLVKGLRLDMLTFAAHRPQPQHWRADISSSQTAGTLFWREAQGRVAGRVDADFDRLSLGSSQAGVSSGRDGDFQVADDLDIPGINLRVGKFRLYGRDVGELTLVGVNQARGNLWKLESLTLKSPSAELSGTGLWRLSGPDRGLSLNAEAQITDLGAYLDQIGYKDVMKAGAGTIKGDIEWRNMPWAFSKADLNGQIEFSLRKGRFSALNSYSARLLELLSLQSVKRLARLDFNPAGLTREGFPYDDLRGTVKVNNGMMSTNDYRVIGPVGTIVIGGTIDLMSELLDLQAVVVPNLDISGAAVAAGIAVNPIVGVGAFLTQWLLQGPLAKAMTVQYQIDGPWSEPRIKEVLGPGGEPGAKGDSGATTQPEPLIEH